MIPKIVFAGTTMAVIRIDQECVRAAGVVTASIAAPTPSSKVRKKIIPTGSASSSAR